MVSFAPMVTITSQSSGQSPPMPPPGVSISEIDSSTVSCERRRVRVAALEITLALTTAVMARFDALENKVDNILQSALRFGGPTPAE